MNRPASAARIKSSASDDIDANPVYPDANFPANVGAESSNYVSEKLKYITERRAGRLNASSISDEEVETLLESRKELLQKQYDGGLDASETRKLALIRWSLDRIDDARSGHILDALEGAIIRYESLREEIKTLMSQLDNLTPKARK